MFKQCTALFLLVATLASTFSKVVIVADFYANQDFISKNLCVNRDKPMANCHGKCQLCKRLAHDENQEKTNPERKPEYRNDVVFFQDLSQLINAGIAVQTDPAQHAMLIRPPVDRAFPIFHPPGC